jgi:putative transposase
VQKNYNVIANRVALDNSDELLNGETFYSLWEAQIITERWRNDYKTKRSHSALGYRPPAQEAIVPVNQRPIMH